MSFFIFKIVRGKFKLEGSLRIVWFSVFLIGFRCRSFCLKKILFRIRVERERGSERFRIYTYVYNI